jgi:hypothetical protein
MSCRKKHADPGTYKLGLEMCSTSMFAILCPDFLKDSACLRFSVQTVQRICPLKLVGFGVLVQKCQGGLVLLSLQQQEQFGLHSVDIVGLQSENCSLLDRVAGLYTVLTHFYRMS